MGRLEEQILLFIQKNPGCTYRQIEAFTGAAHRNSVQYKNHLLDVGLIREDTMPLEGGTYIKTFYPMNYKSNIKQKRK